MIRRVGLAACAFVLLAMTSAPAQQVVTGTVVRIDQPANVIVLDNGQMYQATPRTVFLVNNRPTSFAQIAIPSDGDERSVTVLSEVRAAASARGCVRGEPVELDGPALLELIHVAR